MDGCQEARNAITIAEIPCPRCSNAVEIFLRDGFLAAGSVCEACGYALPAGIHESEAAQRTHT